MRTQLKPQAGRFDALPDLPEKSESKRRLVLLVPAPDHPVEKQEANHVLACVTCPTSNVMEELRHASGDEHTLGERPSEQPARLAQNLDPIRNQRVPPEMAFSEHQP